MFMCSRFFPKGSENKLQGKRKKTIKKETKRKLNMANRMKAENTSLSTLNNSRSNHAPHSNARPHPEHANPKNRYRVGRRENWIFRLSKPHKTRQKSKRGISVALFFLFSFNLNTHIVLFVHPHLNPRLSEFQIVCLNEAPKQNENELDNGKTLYVRIGWVGQSSLLKRKAWHSTPKRCQKVDSKGFPFKTQ